jgi:hypothetical protein
VHTQLVASCALRVSHLGVSYGGVTALSDIDLDVARG